MDIKEEIFRIQVNVTYILFIGNNGFLLNAKCGIVTGSEPTF